MTDDLQKLLDASSPGEWFVEDDGWIYSTEDGPICMIQEGGIADSAHLFNHDPANARLMALAPTLAARVIAAEKVVAAVREAFECGMVPNSTAKNGGAPRHSQQVRVADALRDALAAYDEVAK